MAPRPTLLSIAIALLLAPASSLLAQGNDRVVTGRVVDATTGEPIEVAVVVLEPVPAGVLTPRGASRSLQAARSVTTDATGTYTFRDLPPGTYRLHVTRYSYRPTTVDVEVTRPRRANVSVGLVVDPVAMEPLEAVLPDPIPFATADEDRDDEGARIRLARQRQARFLPSDVRGLTDVDVEESVTLAETDLFRAFQRLPGVTTRDDYTAELWARGAPWSHTRVRFDGLPLFNPLHGAGVFSGVHPDAIGTAHFFPGARPASLAEGAAAVVDLSSRPAGTTGELRGAADVSLVSARGALERGVPDWGWRVTARRSWIDLATWALEALGAGDSVYVPYAFTDLTGRLDLDLGRDLSLEASALWERDAVRGDVVDVLEENPSTWGNLAGRVTLETPLGGLRARHTVGATRFYAGGLGDRIDVPGNVLDPPVEGSLDDAPIDVDHALLWTTLATEIAPAEADLDDRWSAGGSVVLQRQRYAGPAPTPYPGRTTLDSVAVRGELAHAAVWGERRWTFADRLRIDAGLRLEMGGDVEGASATRLAPRLAARWSVPGPAVTLSTGWARTWQYAQVLSPAGLSVGPRLHPNELWFLAGDSIPALRADVVTLGGEAWLGEAWLVSLTGWLRGTTGMLLPDPTPGPIEGAGTIVTGDNRAAGLEVSLRRLVGRWTGSIGYTLSRSEIEADGRTYPASTERRHVLDALASVRIDASLRLGAAFTWASGAPYTRFFSPLFQCPRGGLPCRITQPATIEEPNAERGPSYASFDLTIDWTREHDGWALGVFGQLRNVLDRENALTYQGSETCADLGNVPCGPTGVRDEFERGLPILPAFGVRIVF